MICQTCKNAIFDAQWGEFKCSVKKRNCRNIVGCSDFVNGVPQESKDHEEYNLMREDGE